MSRLGIFIADGCEEVEALTVVDIVRRAKLEIDMISINGTKQVTSSRNVTFMTDTTKEEADFSVYDGIILPGGMPGTVHLGEDDTVSQVIREFEKNENRRELLKAMKGLKERERMILQMRYGIEHEELTQKDIARKLGISQSYISRLEKRILQKLKVQMKVKAD